MIFFDTETVGLHGMPVLIQYAENDSEIKLFEPWKRPIQETLDWVEWFVQNDVCGFNIVFDLFHLNKLYTIFRLHPDPSDYPDEIISEIAKLEIEGMQGPCVKPKRCCDLLLHARKGPYQSLMAREDIRVKRVPTVLAYDLAAELEERIKLDGIYFARRKDQFAPKWKVFETEESDFKDVVLKFAPKGDLKTLAVHALGVTEDELLRFSDIEINHKFRPKEVGYAPYADAMGKPTPSRWAWPEVIKFHIEHWAYNSDARLYAEKDVEYTRGLYEHFGSPEPGDDDSELAGMVAACRWRGFSVDVQKINALLAKAKTKAKSAPKAPRQVLAYVTSGMSDAERVAFGKGTNKAFLEKQIGNDGLKCDCFYDNDEKHNPAGCELCNHTGIHPAISKIKEVLAARRATKEVELYEKLLQAKRFHASFNVIGTLSSRMSGTDGLNAQAINRKEETRECFTLADPGYVLCGGDFDSFEVVLAAAAYDNDPDLVAALQTKVDCHKCPGKDGQPTGVCKECQGEGSVNGKRCPECKGAKRCPECNGTTKTTQKLHGLFAQALYPGKSYEEVVKSKKMYTEGKTAVFSQLYGGTWETIVKKQGFPEEVAKNAAESFARRFPGVGRAQKKNEALFRALTQPGGMGTRVYYKEPADYAESITGFKRFFSLENQIRKALFDLSQSPPPRWKDIKIKITRYERQQTVAGACSSALYGSAFGVQGCIERAAANHVIQSSGATITKAVQRRIWDFQPTGIHEFQVYGMQVHDEIMACCKPEFQKGIQAAVYDKIEEYRPQVPLIAMEWKLGMGTWADK